MMNSFSKIGCALFLFCSSIASAQLGPVKCLDWAGLCNVAVFVEAAYPRPDLHIGIAVSINAYDEQKMEEIFGRVMRDFISNGFEPSYNFSSSGDLPDAFPGWPQLTNIDFRRNYICGGLNGCQYTPGKYLDAFSVGYFSDGLNKTDLEAIRRYVHDETGGRLNKTLTQACVEFDKTCQPTTPPALTTLPPVVTTLPPALTTLPVEPNSHPALVAIVVVAATVGIVASGVGIYVLVRKLKPLLANNDAELQPLRH